MIIPNRYAEEQMKALTSTEDETDDEGNHQSTLEARILSNKYSMSKFHRKC